jgi:hypothetical protein
MSDSSCFILEPASLPFNRIMLVHQHIFMIAVIQKLFLLTLGVAIKVSNTSERLVRIVLPSTKYISKMLDRDCLSSRRSLLS